MTESMGKELMLLSTERMEDFLDLMARFDQLTFNDVTRIVTVGVWNEPIQKAFLEAIEIAKAQGVARPCEMPGLERELRMSVAKSFHIADKVGGTTGIGSMVFKPVRRHKSYEDYNPLLLTWNYDEGAFGRISGLPGAGKTNMACVMAEAIMRKGMSVYSNVALEDGEYPNYVYTSRASDLFSAIADRRGRKWVFILDEGGLIYSKADASTRRAKDLDKLVRVIRKLNGNFIIVEQRPESVPTIMQEFSKNTYYAIRPGIVNVKLEGPRKAFEDVIQDFPKTALPFKTYDISYFDIDVDIQNYLRDQTKVDNHKSIEKPRDIAKVMLTEQVVGSPPPAYGEEGRVCPVHGRRMWTGKPYCRAVTWDRASECRGPKETPKAIETKAPQESQGKDIVP